MSFLLVFYSLSVFAGGHTVPLGKASCKIEGIAESQLGGDILDSKVGGTQLLFSGKIEPVRYIPAKGLLHFLLKAFCRRLSEV